MKKILLILSLIALCSLNCIAQKGTNAYGLKLGPTLDWVGSANAAGNNIGTRAGFNVGLVVDHYYTNHIALSSGLNLNLMRMNYRFADHRRLPNFLQYADLPVNRNFKGSYLEVPLQVKVRIPVMDSWSAYAEVGLGLALNLRDTAKDSYEYYGLVYKDENYTNVSDQYRLFQSRFSFGIGAEYKVNRNLGVFAQIVFNSCFSNMFNRAVQIQTGSNLKTRFVGLEVGAIH